MAKHLSFKNDGHNYSIVVDRYVDSDELVKEIKSFLQKMETMANNNSETSMVEITIKTPNWIMTEDLKRVVQHVFDDSPTIKLGLIESNLTHKSEVKDEVVIVNDTIRNGQTLFFDSDVVFTGKIHDGGVLQSSQNIYIIGKSEGIVHAGYPNNSKASIVGDLSKSTQIRIGEVVHILGDEEQFSNQTKSYINQMNNIVQGNIVDRS